MKRASAVLSEFASQPLNGPHALDAASHCMMTTTRVSKSLLSSASSAVGRGPTCRAMCSSSIRGSLISSKYAGRKGWRGKRQMVGSRRTYATDTAIHGGMTVDKGLSVGYAVAAVAGLTAIGVGVGVSINKEIECSSNGLIGKSGQFGASGMSKLEERFLKYASKKSSTGEALMTAEDFIKSMIPAATAPSKQDADRIRAFFMMADTDHDGLLAFAEYVTFFTLLSKPAAEFEIAFKLFDLNGDGQIEKSEFEKVIGITSEHGGQLKTNSAFAAHFFGEDGTKKLSFNEFQALLIDLKEEILRLEFKQYDPENKGWISGEHFLELITQHSDSVHVPGWLQSDLNASAKASQVTLRQFIGFNHILKDIKQIELAIRMYTATGGHIGKAKFAQAVRVATGVVLDPSELDIIFNIFDRTGKGELDHESFLFLMNNRSQRTISTQKATMSIPQTFLLGGVSAMVGASCVYPMDKIKTRIQSAHGTTTVIGQVRDIGRMFSAILQKEGFFGLYKGMAAQMVGIVPEKAIKITVNDYLKRKIRAFYPDGENPALRELSVKEEAVAGIGTGLFQVFATNPYELVKIRMQMQTPDAPKKSIITIVRELGIRGMYQGLPATLLRDVPFNAIYFSSYSAFKKMLKDRDGNLSGQALFMAGIGAGFLGAALDTPADCLKTRLQNGQGKYKGIYDAATTIYREEGPTAFLKGLAPRILIIAPLFAITFMVFERLQRVFAPQLRPPIQMLHDEFELVRDSRLRHMSNKLETEFGLKVIKI